MHYDYVFFKVSRITAKGIVMGRYLHATQTNEDWDHDTRTDCWRVDPMRTVGKLRRLPKPGLWRVIEDNEIADGITATSCQA